MRKIKRFLVLVLLAGTLTSVFSAGSDVVVLMDASGTILPYFDEINNRILVDITKKFIRQGDTFHLVSFNSRVNLEIVQPIQTESDVSRVVSRFMLLYPLGQNSDFLSGLQYTYQYVSSLDQQNEKIIIVISDGIFNPPATSSFASYTPEQVSAEITTIARKIRGAGWYVYYIKLPFPQNAEIRTLDGNVISKLTSDSDTANADKSKQKKYYDVSTEFTTALDIVQSPLPEDNVPITFVDSVFSMPEVDFPADIGHKGRFFSLPLKVKNTSDSPVNMELTGVYLGDVNILDKSSFLNLSPGSRRTLKADINLPATVSKGSQDLNLRLQFTDNLRVVPQSGTIHLTVTNFSPELLFRTGGPVVYALILILLALILVITLFVFIFKRTASPASDAIRSAGQEADASSGYVKGTSVTAQTAKTARSGQFAVDTSHERAAENARILEAANSKTNTKNQLRAEPAADKQIRYTAETKKYPVLSDMTKETSSQEYIDDLAKQQAAEKNSRLAILTAAAHKAEYHSRIASAAHANEAIVIRENSKIMLSLNVDNQNPNIGKRNIHMMKAGTRLSIGGGTSPFLIFLVKFPSNIAEIRYDGKQCNLAILKPEFFPYENSNVIENCIDREITIVSPKSYEVTFSFRTYEDPVVTLNRMLTSIKYV